MSKIIKLNILCVFSLLFLLPYKQSVGMVTDTPRIIAGKSKITGRVTSQHKTNKDKISVNLFVSYPISGETVQYKTFVDQSGKFSIDVDLETDISMIGFHTSLNREKHFYVKLTNGGITNVDITYNSENEIKNIDFTPDLNKNDMIRGVEVINKMNMYVSGKPEPLYNKSVDYFLNYAKTRLLKRLEIVKNDPLLSEKQRELLSKEYSLILYCSYIFDYEQFMINNYKNTNKDKSKKLDLHQIDRSYFRFLKDFNLNDPQYLSCITFPEFQNNILQNETLRLPLIEDSNISSWLANVKVILADLVGFKDGPYYDILAANAYGRQLNEAVRPLTEKQKTNISNYWKEGEIAKILFRKNQQIVELNKVKTPAVINDISSVPENKVIETILSKHKNKVVFIDLWATWCMPCLQAMRQFRSAKGDYHDKDVVFVYLTDESSPRKLWEEKIEGIGSEHYYLKADQWRYVMNHFELEYIPSYLLFNKEGLLIKKFSSFPGNDEMKEMINDLL